MFSFLYIVFTVVMILVGTLSFMLTVLNVSHIAKYFLARCLGVERLMDGYVVLSTRDQRRITWANNFGSAVCYAQLIVCFIASRHVLKIVESYQISAWEVFMGCGAALLLFILLSMLADKLFPYAKAAHEYSRTVTRNKFAARKQAESKP